MQYRQIAILSAVGLIAGCGGGGGGSGGGGNNLLQGCAPISGGGTQVSSTVDPLCTSCSVSNDAAAIDGNGATYATLGMPANSSGTIAFRATAQSGVIFPAGSLVGMVHSISYENSTLVSITLTTYAAGVEQESFNFNNGSGSSTQDPSSPGRVSYTTSQQYDAVELSFTRANGGVVEARVHEFCSN